MVRPIGGNNGGNGNNDDNGDDNGDNNGDDNGDDNGADNGDDNRDDNGDDNGNDNGDNNGDDEIAETGSIDLSWRMIYNYIDKLLLKFFLDIIEIKIHSNYLLFKLL